MYTRWASRLLRVSYASSSATAQPPVRGHDPLARWLHASPTVLESRRQQQLGLLSRDLERLVTKGASKHFAGFKLPDFVKRADATQLAKMRASLAQAEAEQRDKEFALLQRDLDQLEAQGKHFRGLEKLRKEKLKKKTTFELSSIRQQLARRFDEGALPLRRRPVMHRTAGYPMTHEVDNSNAKDVAPEDVTLDATSVAMLSDVHLLKRPYKYIEPATRGLEWFRKWLKEQEVSALEGARLVKTTHDKDGNAVHEDLGPATARDVSIYGHPAYVDAEDKAQRKEDSDLALHDPHPFGGSTLPAPLDNPGILDHPLDHMGLRPDVANYVLRREVVVELTHELDERYVMMMMMGAFLFVVIFSLVFPAAL